mmetsp:Transcript_15858/g.37844  ORF Transcript_15858/g.37844 Transcript_15858/m.37844 type:complete len:337 (+) Transcript_15858:1202-2212(+)
MLCRCRNCVSGLALRCRSSRLSLGSSRLCLVLLPLACPVAVVALLCSCRCPVGSSVHLHCCLVRSQHHLKRIRGEEDRVVLLLVVLQATQRKGEGSHVEGEGVALLLQLTLVLFQLLQLSTQPVRLEPRRFALHDGASQVALQQCRVLCVLHQSVFELLHLEHRLPHHHLVALLLLLVRHNHQLVAIGIRHLLRLASCTVGGVHHLSTHLHRVLSSTKELVVALVWNQLFVVVLVCRHFPVVVLVLSNHKGGERTVDGVSCGVRRRALTSQHVLSLHNLRLQFLNSRFCPPKRFVDFHKLAGSLCSRIVLRLKGALRLRQLGLRLLEALFQLCRVL